MPGRSLRPATCIAAALVFAWAFRLRTDGISRDFWLLQDQVGDWQTVQGNFASLPLTGPAKTGGGTHLGPFYYWWLWLARNALAPWTGRLPHAMGIATGALDAAAFALLLPAIESAGVPLLASAGAVLLASTVPYEAALARAGWNPCFALACLDLALALFLLGRHRMTTARAALVTAIAWAGVASHLSAIVVAMPILACTVAAASPRGSRRSLAVAATVAAVVLAMQVPWLLAQQGIGTRAWTPTAGDLPLAMRAGGTTAPGRANPGDPGPPDTPSDAGTAVTRTMDAIGAEPARLLSARGISFVAGEAPALLLRSLRLPPPVPTALLAIAAALVVAGLLRGRIEALPAAAALLPLAVAAVACGALEASLPSYFAIALLGPLGLLSALAVASLPPRAATVGGLLLLASALAGQPHRVEDRRWDHSWRWYEPTVRGAREVAARGIPVRAVEGPGPDHGREAASALAHWLGATIEPTATSVARISGDGSVRWVDSP